MRIVYTGGFDEVDVPYIEDNVEKRFTAKNGEPAECPDELAELLLEQADIWKRAESTARPGRKTEAITPAG